MPTFEKLVTSRELEHLTQELYMLEQEQQLLGIDHSGRIEEIHEALGLKDEHKKDSEIKVPHSKAKKPKKR